MPGRSRPGNMRARLEHSMASTAGWRTIAETTPSPTGMRSVAARAAAAQATPPVKK